MKIRLFDLGFYSLVILYSIKMLAFYNIPDMVENGIMLSAAILLLCEITRKSYKFKELIIITVLSLLALYTCVITKQFTLLVTVLVLFASKGVPIEHIVKKMFKIHLTVFLIGTLGAILVLPFDASTLVSQGRTLSEIRVKFLFGHANGCSLIIFWTMIEWLYLNYNKCGKKKIIFLITIEWIFSYLTKTRTAFIIFIIMVLLFHIQKGNNPIVKKIIVSICKILFPVLALFFCYISTAYRGLNTIVISMFDTFLSSRLRLGAAGFENYGSTALGQYIDTSLWKFDAFYGLNNFTFDNLYNQFYVNIGFVYLIIISISIYRYLKNKKLDMNTLVLFCWILYAITESDGINVCITFPIILLRDTIYWSRDKRIIKETGI